MTAFLIFLASIPAWAAGAIVGAIFGVCGVLAGEGLRRLGWQGAIKVMPVVFIVASLTLTQKVLIPAGVDASLNQGLPRQIDELTILEKVSKTPQGLAYDFRLVGDIPAGVNGETVKESQIAGLCSNWSPDFKAGRASRIDYRYQSSAGSFAFAVAPSDCP